MLDLFRYLIQVILSFVFPPKLKMSNLLSVYIKSSIGNTLSVELDPKWDIRNLKGKIAPKLGLSPDDIKIIFAGKELMDCIVIEVLYLLTYFVLTVHLKFIVKTMHWFVT